MMCWQSYSNRPTRVFRDQSLEKNSWAVQGKGAKWCWSSTLDSEERTKGHTQVQWFGRGPSEPRQNLLTQGSCRPGCNPLGSCAKHCNSVKKVEAVGIAMGGNLRLQTAQRPFRNRKQTTAPSGGISRLPQDTNIYFVKKVSYHYNTCRALLARQKALTLLSYETFKYMVNHIHAQACFTGNHVAQPGALSFTRCCPIVTKVT